MLLLLRVDEEVVERVGMELLLVAAMGRRKRSKR